jgi:hypothetical protein
VRAVRRRTKKLIVAFHFQLSNQAAWKCDGCRKRGLEKQRRCGWLEQETPPRVVWARKNQMLTTCPTSYISADSLSWLEQYCTWKLLGRTDIRSLPARAVEAFWILENELLEERDHVRD